MSDATAARDARSGVLDALIAGRSLPALLAALDLAEVGLSVAVANGPLDLPSEAPRDPEGGIAAFVQRIASPIDAGASEPHRAGSAAPRAELSRAPSSTPWLLDPSGAWAPQSTPSVLGIPAVPIAPENLRLLGTGGAVRAYMDRVKPVLTIGKTRTVGDLVRARLGAKACDRLVDPLVRERYGVAADEVDMAVAVPGLNEALSRAGSLSAAVYSYSDRYAAEESGVEPIDGWEAFAAAVIARLSLFEVRFLESTVVGARFEGETWRVELVGGDEIGSAAVDAEATELQARSLVLDRSGTGASERLIADLAPGVAPTRHRSYAEVDIQSPGELPDDAVGVRALGDGSLTIRKTVDGVRRARFSSPVKLGDRGELGRGGEAGIIGELTPALRAAGLEISEGAVWLAGLEAAPHATLEQRHRVDDALAAIAEAEEPLLPVGRELHGGDLGAALDSAHRGSVELRRRLLGLSE